MSIPRQSLSKSTIRQQRLKLDNIKMLGGRCSNGEKCGWHNEDGTRGCTNVHALQFDHRHGGGSEARRTGRDGLAGLYYIKNNPKLFQLLCANCNWIKRHKNEEARGAYQFKQPALVRRSLGQHGRRVTESQTLKDGRERLELLKAERSFLAARERQKNRETKG